MEIGDTGFSTKDVANVASASAKLSRNLPGMMGQSNQNEDERPPTPKICESCNQPIVICPTCHQKVVTSQPQGGGVNANQALKTTQGAFNCCSKLFSCLGEEGEIEDPTAE